MLNRHALYIGACLRCFKKADHFGKWIVKHKPELYALLTDWREIKHCVDTIDEQSVDGRPLFTVVFCADAKQQRKAQSWVSRLTCRSDPVHILGDFASAEGILPCLLYVMQAKICVPHSVELTNPQIDDREEQPTFFSSNRRRDAAPSLHACQNTQFLAFEPLEPMPMIEPWDSMDSPRLLQQPIEIEHQEGKHAHEEDARFSHAANDNHPVSDHSVCARQQSSLVYL